MSLAGLEIPWIIDHMAQPVMMREMKGSCFILSILVTNKYKQALLSITMHMDTETTKNNLLFMVARTWLGHLSFPRWLLSFVYPHTSWMLIIDSFLVCTNEGGKNSTLLWEAAAWSRRTKSRIRGGPVSQYSGTSSEGVTWSPHWIFTNKGWWWWWYVYIHSTPLRLFVLPCHAVITTVAAYPSSLNIEMWSE